MDQSKKKPVLKEVNAGQFNYLGRWVEKETFRAFVYAENGIEKLANSFDEFETLISSGLWFAEKPELSKERKQKHGTSRTNSK